MDLDAGWITAGATVALNLSVIIAGMQIRHSQLRARTDFEDRLVREYRDLAQQIPVEALLGGTLTEAERLASRGAFYHYFNLTNAQVFLATEGRISKRTWRHWKRGIRTNLSRPEFQRTWLEIRGDHLRASSGSSSSNRHCSRGTSRPREGCGPAATFPRPSVLRFP